MRPNWVLSQEQCSLRFRRQRQQQEKAVKQEAKEPSSLASPATNMVTVKREVQASPVATSEYTSE